MEAGQLHSTERLQTQQIFLKHLASNMKQVVTLAVSSMCEWRSEEQVRYNLQ